MISCYNDPSIFIKNELKTLEFLKNNCASHPDLIGVHDRASKSYSIAMERQKKIAGLNTAQRSTVQNGINSLFSWEIIQSQGKNEVLEITVGTLIESTNEELKNITYLLMVSQDDAKTKNVIKKFHFDFTHPSTERSSSQPAIHLQHGGKLPPGYKETYSIEKLQVMISEPRIFYNPMSLALVLQIAFMEFPCCDTNKILKEPEWKKLILRDQELLLKPFFLGCLNNINSSKLLHEEIYVD